MYVARYTVDPALQASTIFKLPFEPGKSMWGVSFLGLLLSVQLSEALRPDNLITLGGGGGEHNLYDTLQQLT